MNIQYAVKNGVPYLLEANPRAITQAHVGYVHGDSLVAKKVRFISRLNLNPLNGAKNSYYEDCHFECTDDALNGTATYRHCQFDFYGQKPFWSTFGAGALFIDCDFYVKGENREMYFTKQGGPVTVINSRYHAPSDAVQKRRPLFILLLFPARRAFPDFRPRAHAREPRLGSRP